MPNSTIAPAGCGRARDRSARRATRICGGQLITLALASPAAAHLVVVAHTFGGMGADSGEDLAVDAGGNRYLTGSFQGQATFGLLGDIGDGDDTEAGPPEDPVNAPGQERSLFLPILRR